MWLLFFLSLFARSFRTMFKLTFPLLKSTNGKRFKQVSWSNLEYLYIYHGVPIPGAQKKSKISHIKPPPKCTFSFLNISMSFSRVKAMKVWKRFWNFQTFRKFLKKGLGTPTTYPNLQLKLWKKIKNPNPREPKSWSFDFFKVFNCRYGCVVGAPSRFFKNFRKLWKF